MRPLLWKPVSIVSDRALIDTLVMQVGRLVRHRGYVRANIVSAMLRKYLPADSDYAWGGEAALRTRLHEAGLDQKTLEHLAASARSELAKIKERARE